MNSPTRLLAAFGLLAAAALPLSLMAQNVPPSMMAQNATPKDLAGKVASPGTAVAPPKGTMDGGKRPPVDATGQTAPAGTPLAPSRLAGPGAPPSPPATARP